jgi:hypothetical protein
LQELNGKQAVVRLAPWAAAAVVLAGVWLSVSTDWFPAVAALVVGAVVWLGVSQWDALRTSTVIMYDLDPEARSQFEHLVADITALGSAQSLWHVATTATVLDRKYHAGASDVIRRTSTGVVSGLPKRVRCNIDVPSILVGRQALYFFPDRVLVVESNAVGAVGYDALSVARDTTKFIEEDGVPRDARVVDKTWRYVNRNGGPDKRFKDNRELPVCLYETIHFTSNSGLNELLHVSRIGVGEPIVAAIASTGKRRILEAAQRNAGPSGPATFAAPRT